MEGMTKEDAEKEIARLKKKLEKRQRRADKRRTIQEKIAESNGKLDREPEGETREDPSNGSKAVEFAPDSPEMFSLSPPQEHNQSEVESVGVEIFAKGREIWSKINGKERLILTDQRQDRSYVI